jgi:hypothetical protein
MCPLFTLTLSQVGYALVRLTQVVCEQHAAPFKSDAMSWGVTTVADERMTPFEFGDFKSEEREKTEMDAIKYISEPSQSRQRGTDIFGIAATVAAPGTGKTRLLDDLLRATVPTTHYNHFLRLPITFNGKTTGDFTHPVAVRALLQFVCGTTRVTAKRPLRTLDGHLRSVCGSLDVELFALDVLDAVEAVYFELRGGVLARSVLLIDEIRLASFTPRRADAEVAVYDCVKSWLDAGLITVDGNSQSRRGAVFTGVSVLSPFALESSTGRPIVPLPLGIFDVYDDSVRAVIELQAGCKIHPAGWALLAATGGRPRDILDILDKVAAVGGPGTSDRDLLLPILCDVADEDRCFEEYLLPSLLCVLFKPFMRKGFATQFGRDAASLSLLNADSASSTRSAVPAVSLRYVNTLADSTLRSIVRRLVSTMVFDVLDGSGKDFERAWALLAMCVLQLQYFVRNGAHTGTYWPAEGETVNERGGPHRPTATKINVFAKTEDSSDRIEALFTSPRAEYVFEAPGSTFHRVIHLSAAPTLAVWHDPWARTVTPGCKPPKWPDSIQCDVVWRSSTIVHFEMTNTAAIDCMLLVGDAGGIGQREPHVYMFQCKAWQTRNMAQADMKGIVNKLSTALATLFSPPFAKTHVLRKAGVHNARQITLCVAAISFGAINFAAPFNIVLFDSVDFRAMCGSAFVNTTFCQHFKI